MKNILIRLTLLATVSVFDVNANANEIKDEATDIHGGLQAEIIINATASEIWPYLLDRGAFDEKMYVNVSGEPNKENEVLGVYRQSANPETSPPLMLITAVRIIPEKLLMYVQYAKDGSTYGFYIYTLDEQDGKTKVTVINGRTVRGLSEEGFETDFKAHVENSQQAWRERVLPRLKQLVEK